MIRYTMLMIGLCLSCCASSAAVPDTGQVVADSSDELAERTLILDKVKTAVVTHDFAGLSAMEEDFRSTRVRTPSGVWKLGIYHLGVQGYLAEGLRREDACQLQDPTFIRRWADAVPHNPAPAITDAALHLARAWCFRGSGYASSVPAEAWPDFEREVAAAAAVLNGPKRSTSVDPEFYAVKLTVLRAQGVSRSVFRGVLDEATAREPSYLRTYANAAWFYMPQWGGSYAEVEALARYAMDRTRTTDHQGAYARVFWHLEECGCRIIKQAADWPTLKQAMRDVYTRYPVPWNGKYFAEVTCKMGDGEEGRRYIRATHPDAPDDKSLAALFASCDKQARSAD